MSIKLDSIAINNPSLDKRVKLTPMQKEELKELYHIAKISLRGLARYFKVDRKTLKFVLFPDFYQKELQRNKDRGWEKYYNKDKHRVDIAKHRQYKNELLAVNLIG